MIRFTAEHDTENEGVIIKNSEGKITAWIPYEEIAGEAKYMSAYCLMHSLIEDSCFTPEELGLVNNYGI